MGIKKGDIVVLTVIAAVEFALIVFCFTSGESGRAAVYCDGTVSAVYSLNQADRIIEIDGYRGEVRLFVSQGRICFLSAECPDQICVKTGWISRPGRVAVCAVNRVVVLIEGESETDVVLR